MFNQRVISVHITNNPFVSKIQIVLKESPKPFPNFIKEIGVAPNLAKLFKIANQKGQFYPLIDKFENYIKKAYDDTKTKREAIDQCYSWIAALKELFKVINKNNEVTYIEDRIGTLELQMDQDNFLKRHRARKRGIKLFTGTN
jgi:hypothetical protein